MSFLIVWACTCNLSPLDTTNERYYKVTLQLARVALFTSFITLQPLVSICILLEYMLLLRLQQRYQIMQIFLVVLGLFMYCISRSRIVVVTFAVLNLIESAVIFPQHVIPGILLLVDFTGLGIFILSMTVIVQGMLFFLLNKTYCWQDFIILCIRIIYYTGINRH